MGRARGPDGRPLAVGDYAVQASLVVGETHFPMLDIESNPEATAIWAALGPNEPLQPLPMFWDDTPIGGTTSLPYGSAVPGPQGGGVHERHAWDDDWQPALGAVPTLKWIRGSQVVDRHLLSLPQTFTGERTWAELVAYERFREAPLPPMDGRFALAPIGSWPQPGADEAR